MFTYKHCSLYHWYIFAVTEENPPANVLSKANRLWRSFSNEEKVVYEDQARQFVPPDLSDLSDPEVKKYSRSIKVQMKELVSYHSSKMKVDIL